MKEVVTAVYKMHLKNIKHRDMHFKNIMLDFPDLHPTEADFEKAMKRPKPFYKELQEKKLKKLRGFTSDQDFKVKIIDLGFSKQETINMNNKMSKEFGMSK